MAFRRICRCSGKTHADACSALKMGNNNIRPLTQRIFLRKYPAALFLFISKTAVWNLIFGLRLLVKRIIKIEWYPIFPGD
jgi:hypothetical protein